MALGFDDHVVVVDRGIESVLGGKGEDKLCIDGALTEIWSWRRGAQRTDYAGERLLEADRLAMWVMSFSIREGQ